MKHPQWKVALWARDSIEPAMLRYVLVDCSWYFVISPPLFVCRVPIVITVFIALWGINLWMLDRLRMPYHFVLSIKSGQSPSNQIYEHNWVIHLLHMVFSELIVYFWCSLGDDHLLCCKYDLLHKRPWLDDRAWNHMVLYYSCLSLYLALYIHYFQPESWNKHIYISHLYGGT